MTRLRLFLTFAALLLLWGIVGHMDYQDEMELHNAKTQAHNPPR